MASLIHTRGLMVPCHTMGFHKLGMGPLVKGLIKYEERKLSSVKYKKEKAAYAQRAIKAALKDAKYETVDYAVDVERAMPSQHSSQADDDGGGGIERTLVQAAQSSPDFESLHRFVEGILEMSRPQNIVPSMILVLLGGWLGAGRHMDILFKPGQVWIAVGCCACITMASMLVNDIFDFRSGTDQANGKTSPLLRGQIQLYHVELVASCLYGTAIIGLCYLEPIILRLIVGAAIITTCIYTPILKNITLVKNMTVSGIISSSVLLGALSIGAKGQLENSTAIFVALFIFLCFLGREILMDVVDVAGDKAAGVHTLAVRFGGQTGTLTAGVFLAAANALLVSLLAIKAQAFAIIGTLIFLPLHAKMLSLWKELGVTKETMIKDSMRQIVEQSIIHIGFATIVLAAVA